MTFEESSSTIVSFIAHYFV